MSQVKFKISEYAGRYLPFLILTVAALLAVTSVFIDSSHFDMERVAARTTRKIDKQFDAMDAYAQKLLKAPVPVKAWPKLDRLPDYMVLYRYDNDTISCWYNQFLVRGENISTRTIYPCISDLKAILASPLAAACEEPRFINLDKQWYVVRMLSEGSVKVVEGLLVKDERKENITVGQTGLSRYLSLGAQFDVANLMAGEGAPVYVDGLPVFNVVISHDSLKGTLEAKIAMCRWLSIMLLALAAVSWLYAHPGLRNCLAVIIAIALMAILSRVWEGHLSNVSRFFSPSAFASDGILDSYASLLIFNITLFLVAVCVYCCRKEIAVQLSPSSKRSMAAYICGGLAMVLYFGYIYHTFVSLIKNSGLTLERFQTMAFPWLTTISYLSFATLCASVWLIGESVAALVRERRGNSFTLMRLDFMAGYSLAMAALLVSLSLYYGFIKEQDRVVGWSNRIALDRDLRVEMDLNTLDKDLASDPLIRSYVEEGGAESIIKDRLENLYMGKILQNYNLSLYTKQNLGQEEYLSMMHSLGQFIAPDSHFLYSYDDVLGSCYNGLIGYRSDRGTMSALVCRLEPRRSVRQVLPSAYAYAKYRQDRLVDFSGTYPYPTRLTPYDVDIYNVGSNFKWKGYRHFVNVVNDDEVIVVSRPVRGAMSLFVAYSMMTMLVFAAVIIFRPRRRRDEVWMAARSFSTKMQVLTIASLVITLLTMASVSVLFVYQRNDRTVHNQMISKINAVQLFLDETLHNVVDYRDMPGDEFARKMNDISRATGTEIDLYSPSGALFFSMSTSPNPFLRPSARVDSKAYQSILFSRQRYYVSSRSSGIGMRRHVMYAPVFNAEGRMLCIAAVPYMYQDYDLMRNALIHSAAILSLFLFLLFATILFTSHISKSIFSPLTSLRQKMKSMGTGKLEQVEYDGDDEISALVEAYNSMVVNMRDNTAALAAAERDRAWSAMARQVTHEIKNPLTPIKLNIQRLQRLKQKGDASWQDRFDDVARILLENIDILTETADEFGTYAKLSTEDPVDIDLDKMLQDQMLLFGETGVKFTYLGMREAHIIGPRPQLSRVFVNLLTNAVQALGAVENPMVMVSLRRDDGHWDVAIEDNGPGVPQENLSKLFTPNFTTKSGGTGLGLAMSRSVLETMGGTITYSRSFVLGGACFTVHFPAEWCRIGEDMGTNQEEILTTIDKR